MLQRYSQHDTEESQGLGIQDLRAADFWVIPGWIDSKWQEYVSVSAFVLRKPAWEERAQVNEAGKDCLPSASSKVALSISPYSPLALPLGGEGWGGTAYQGQMERQTLGRRASLGPT